MRLADFSAAAVVRPGGGNLVVTAQPLQGEDSGALAVSPAAGTVRAEVLVGATELSAPVTAAGGATLFQAGAACIVPGSGACRGRLGDGRHPPVATGRRGSGGVRHVVGVPHLGWL